MIMKKNLDEHQIIIINICLYDFIGLKSILLFIILTSSNSFFKLSIINHPIPMGNNNKPLQPPPFHSHIVLDYKYCKVWIHKQTRR